MLDADIYVSPIKKYPTNIIELIKGQCERNLALKWGDIYLTYGELEKRSDELAFKLREQGIVDEEKVVVMLPLSFELVISIYAILKAGACYVPLNATDGKDRFQFIMDDLGGRLVIGNDETLDRINGLTTAELWNINSISLKSPKVSLPEIKPEGLAYIIYTSGTTGRPKGVMVEHSNLFSFIEAMRKAIDIDINDRWLQNYNVHFDLAVGTMFLSLCNGSILVLETGDLSELMEIHDITHYLGTPSVASLCDPELLPHLKVMAVAGEKCPDELIARYAPFNNLFVGYGPAETTILCTLNQSNQWTQQNIGTVFAGSEYYVVKSDGTLAEEGESGELWIAGNLVARGYLNRADLSSEKFIKNPFGEGKIYKSGDRVRWVKPGFMEFVGRVDRQVKIRGNRIELDGLELLINRFAGIKGTHAKVINDNLVTYIICDSIDENKLITHLKKQLPPYAIPNKIVYLKEFPLTRSGKIDSTGFPDPFKASERTGILPQTKSQKALAQIWISILPGVDEVYLEDNFFDLGGNSLHILKVFQKIRKYFANPKIPVELLYRNTKLKDLINALENWQEDAAPKYQGNIYVSVLKALPTTFYFALGFVFPFFTFSLLCFKFPFLIIYAVFEYLFFGLIKGPVSFSFLRRIIYSPIFHKISFKKIEIIEEEALENIKGNLICLHPHGVCDIHLYPLASRLWNRGIKFKVAFERHIFALPFNRTLLSITGNVPATEKTYLKCKEKGENLFVTPCEQPGYLNAYKPATLALDSKLDFFKMAIKTGMPLIPVFVFNLNKHFKYYPELLSCLDKLPLDPSTARFILPYSGKWLTPLPFRHDLKMAIGCKIPVIKNLNPTYEEILEVKNRYKKEMRRIFEKHKPEGHAPLEII